MKENEYIKIALSDIEDYLTTRYKADLVWKMIYRIRQYIEKPDCDGIETSYIVRENDEGELDSSLKCFIEAEINFLKLVFDFDDYVNEFISGTNKTKVNAMRKRSWRLIIRYFKAIYDEQALNTPLPKIFKIEDLSLQTLADYFLGRLCELTTSMYDEKQDKIIVDDWSYLSRLECATHTLNDMNDAGITNIAHERPGFYV